MFGWLKRNTGMPEERANYSDAVLEILQARADGVDTTSPLPLACIEVAAGLWSRSLGAGVVTGSPIGESAVTASVLSEVGRSLIRAGESLHVMELTDTGLRLMQPARFEIRGGPDPASWVYRVLLQGPDRDREVVLMSEDVIHCRVATMPGRPWEGYPLWRFASETAAVARIIESNLASEARAPFGYLLGLPRSPQTAEDKATRKLEKFRASLKASRGTTLLHETTTNWQDDTRRRTNIETTRFGFDPAEVVDRLRGASASDILLACGVPLSLANAANDGVGAREGLRRFLHTTIRPVSTMIRDELRDKLASPALEIGLDELNAADVAGRARAISQLLGAGVHAEDAARITGVELNHPITPPAPGPGDATE